MPTASSLSLMSCLILQQAIYCHMILNTCSPMQFHCHLRQGHSQPMTRFVFLQGGRCCAPITCYLRP